MEKKFIFILFIFVYKSNTGASTSHTPGSPHTSNKESRKNIQHSPDSDASHATHHDPNSDASHATHYDPKSDASHATHHEPDSDSTEQSLNTQLSCWLQYQTHKNSKYNQYRTKHSFEDTAQQF